MCARPFQASYHSFVARKGQRPDRRWTFRSSSRTEPTKHARAHRTRMNARCICRQHSKSSKTMDPRSCDKLIGSGDECKTELVCYMTAESARADFSDPRFSASDRTSWKNGTTQIKGGLFTSAFGTYEMSALCRDRSYISGRIAYAHVSTVLRLT